jgi:hypothetical protein
MGCNKMGQKTIIWPIRFIPLSLEEVSDHALLCVVAYYGGYCGLQAAYRRNAKHPCNPLGDLFQRKLKR